MSPSAEGASAPFFWFNGWKRTKQWEHGMPRRLTVTKEGTRQTLKNVSHELKVASWLMRDGWQVFTPVLDNGHATDILISDGPKYYRLQIKTVDAGSEDQSVTNKWKGSDVDLVIYFARNSNWGYIVPAFDTDKRKLNAGGHLKFMDNKNDFLVAFHQV